MAVVFGGRSSEHAISCVSAGSVLSHLDPERFEVVPVGITRDGGWVLGTDDPRELVIDRRTLPEVDGTRTALALPGDPTRGGLVVLDPDRAGEVFSGVDVVFPVLHGPFGEDGTIQGLLEMAGVPYVGSGVLASAAGMDKEYGKKLLAAEGIPVGDLVVLRPGTRPHPHPARSAMAGPAGVRQAGQGRLVGRHHPGRRLGRARRGHRNGPGARPEGAGRGGDRGPRGGVRGPGVPGRHRSGQPAGRDPDRRRPGRAPQFYDFDAKYLDDVCEFDIPAKLDDEVAERLREMAVDAFHALDGQGLARVDFFVGPAGELTVNEVNTMPGFTPISIFPRAWAVTGIDYPTLLSTLVETAIARGTGLR